MACRQWGLRVSEIMQATIFGIGIEENLKHTGLYNDLIVIIILELLLIDLLPKHYVRGN